MRMGVLCGSCNGQMHLLRSALLLQVIRINQAHYSAWAWRWQCFEALLPDHAELLEQELRFLQDIATMNAKNYQLWNYRRRFAEFCRTDHADAVRLAETQHHHAGLHDLLL